MTPLIESRALTIHRPGTTEPVLAQVDFRIRPAEIVTVVGPNRSGKSSLIRALLGHMPLASGAVTRRQGLRIGYVPQRVQLDTAIPMTVRRFLSLPVRVLAGLLVVLAGLATVVAAYSGAWRAALGAG